MAKQNDLLMGRYRRLYESYTDGKRINQISLEAEAWFWRIYVKADDYGNFPAEPHLVYMQTAGRRHNVTKEQIAGWIKEMESKGLIRLYLDGEDWYLHVLSFTKMQPVMGGPGGRRRRRYPPAPWETERDNYMPLLESSGAQPDPASRSADQNGDININNNSNNSLSKEQKDYTRTKGLERKDFVVEGYRYWLKKMKMNANTKLTPERIKKLEARWADSTFEELKLAIDGCESSDFHMGRQPNNPVFYNDITIICRNRAKLEWFRDKIAHKLFRPDDEDKRERQRRAEERWRNNGEG